MRRINNLAVVTNTWLPWVSRFRLDPANIFPSTVQDDRHRRRRPRVAFFPDLTIYARAALRAVGRLGRVSDPTDSFQSRSVLTSVHAFTGPRSLPEMPHVNVGMPTQRSGHRQENPTRRSSPNRVRKHCSTTILTRCPTPIGLLAPISVAGDQSPTLPPLTPRVAAHQRPRSSRVSCPHYQWRFLPVRCASGLLRHLAPLAVQIHRQLRLFLSVPRTVWSSYPSVSPRSFTGFHQGNVNRMQSGHRRTQTIKVGIHPKACLKFSRRAQYGGVAPLRWSDWCLELSTGPGSLSRRRFGAVIGIRDSGHRLVPPWAGCSGVGQRRRGGAAGALRAATEAREGTRRAPPRPIGLDDRTRLVYARSRGWRRAEDRFEGA